MHPIYFASGLAGAQQAVHHVTGMLGTATGWLTGLGAGGGGVMVGYHQVMRMFSGGDPQVDAHHQSATKKVLVGACVVAGAGALAHFAVGVIG